MAIFNTYECVLLPSKLPILGSVKVFFSETANIYKAAIYISAFTVQGVSEKYPKSITWMCFTKGSTYYPQNGTRSKGISFR